MAKTRQEPQTGTLSGLLGIEPRRADRLVATARGIFQSTGHLHGLTKTARPLVDLAVLAAAAGADRDRAAAVRAALDQAAPDLTEDARRAVLDTLAVPARPPRRSDGLHPLAPRLAAIARLALGIDTTGKQATRLAGIRDDGRSLVLLLHSERGALRPAASALEAAALWNRLMPRPVHGVRLCARSEPADEVMSPVDGLGPVIERICQRQIEQLVSRLYGLDDAEDIEYVHEMRVALRRARAAVRLFRGSMADGASAFRSDAKVVAKKLGAVRDLDVFLRFLREYRATVPRGRQKFVAGLIEFEEAERGRRCAALARYFRSSGWKKFRGRYARPGVPPVRAEGGRSLRCVCGEAPRLLLKQLKKVAREAGPLDGRAPDELHALRIRCKRLRYAAEFFSGIYPGRLANVIEPMEALQDHLGDVHDADVYTERVRTYLAAPDAAASAKAADALAAHVAEWRKAALARAAAEWARFTAPGHLKAVAGQIESPRDR